VRLSPTCGRGEPSRRCTHTRCDGSFLIRQSAKRDRTPKILAAGELKALLAELAGVYRVMVLVAVTTGPRVSELLGLRWLDCDFEDGGIQHRRERLEPGILAHRIGALKDAA
jgi:integrase